MSLTKDKTNLSKRIAYLLRHNPEGLEMDDEGYVNVNELCEKLKVSFSELDYIVTSDEKKRYAYNGDKSLIRASQGHSIKGLKLNLKTVVPPTILYHGAKVSDLASIKKHGLLKMNRHHVHLSKDEETAQRVADRRDGESIVLEIDAKWMVADGIEFYISDNDVYLTDTVPPEYIKNLNKQ